MSFTRTAARADAGRVGAGRCCGVRGVCGALPGRSGGGRGDGISADARRTGDRGGVDGFSMSRSPRGDADCCSRDGGPGLCGARKLSASSARRMPSSTGTAAIWLFVDSQGFRHMASTVRAGLVRNSHRGHTAPSSLYRRVGAHTGGNSALGVKDTIVIFDVARQLFSFTAGVLRLLEGLSRARGPCVERCTSERAS